MRKIKPAIANITVDCIIECSFEEVIENPFVVQWEQIGRGSFKDSECECSHTYYKAVGIDTKTYAFGSLGSVDLSGNIGGIFVIPDYRLRGVGTLLTEYLIDLSEESGNTEVYTYTLYPKFYLKHGFIHNSIKDKKGRIYVEKNQNVQHLLNIGKRG